MDTTNSLIEEIIQPADSLTAIPGGITLTGNQQSVHDQLLSWLIDKSQTKPAVFKGYAGVGKSTVLTKFVESVRRLHSGRFSIGMTAPTHKAVKVLRRHAIKTVDYRTLHSMLALREQVNEFTGEVTYEPEKFSSVPPPITDINLLIVDETSMLTDQLFTYLVPWVKKGLKVIFTGDSAQIPPVKHLDCVPFRNAQAWQMPTWELTEIMRQKNGNPIISYVTGIRSALAAEVFHPVEHLLDNGTGISLLESGSLREKELLKEMFTNPEFNKDSDFMKVIAWRNVTVNNYNDTIRGIIYSHEPHLYKIMLNEKLIMEKPYAISPRQLLTKNDEVEVKTITTLSKPLTWGDAYGAMDGASLKFYNVGIQWMTETGIKQGNIPIIHDESVMAFTKILDALKNMALQAPADKRSRMWKQYYKVMGGSAWVKYNYAITSHLAQGSTYQNALVLQWDILANKKTVERNRILYTACTRAASTLYIET